MTRQRPGSQLVPPSPNSIDSFINHKTSDRSGGFLSKWRKKDQTSKINVWFHKRRMPIALWQHQIPRLFVKADKDTHENATFVWSQSLNCRETEKTLKRQHFRNDQGLREVPPALCPICRMIEAIRDLVETGVLDWTKVVFKFEGDKETKVIHAGGIYNGFKSEYDELTPEEKKKIRDAGIRMDEVWNENAYAKCNYVFCVVNHNAPGDGVQIATETSLLGDKVKEVFNDTIEAKGAEAGNPFLKPYCVQWEHRPSEQEFQKRYKARPMDFPLTPEIEALISGEPPDISGVLKPFNLKTMRAFLERHATIALPWDSIFDVPGDDEEDENENEKFPPTDTKAHPDDNPLPKSYGGTAPDVGDGEDLAPSARRRKPKVVRT